jgi:prepilin-type N-terminal cleavage/methylation domain-containing protein
MKTELKAKFLQHLLKNREEQGFTLIELLVVIIIIGILAAIALPSFLNQANKAKQSEAKTYVGSTNRGQQAYFLENNAFAPTFTDLGIGVVTGTDNYTYTIPAPNSDQATVKATPLAGSSLKGYSGLTWIEAPTNPGESATSKASICEGSPNNVPGASSTC